MSKSLELTDYSTLVEAYTATRLAQVAGVNLTYIARLCKRGIIPARKFAGAWIISQDVAETWMQERREKLAVKQQAQNLEA